MFLKLGLTPLFPGAHFVNIGTCTYAHTHRDIYLFRDVGKVYYLNVRDTDLNIPEVGEAYMHILTMTLQITFYSL